jgi:cysteine-rich repeat protein
MKQLFLLASLLSSGCLFATGLVSKDCNDGFVDAQEECDDANDINDDGCTNACSLPACGDGILQSGEACDDGNQAFGDGCDDTCLIEVSEFTVPDINNTNVNQARFAIFSNRVSSIDLHPDGTAPDGTVDVDLAALHIIISDKENFCDLIAADPFALDNLPDLEAIQVVAFRRGPVGNDAFLSTQSVTTKDNLLTTVFNTSDSIDSRFVGAKIIKRIGGIDQVVANTPAFQSNDGAMFIEEVSPEKLRAQMTVTLTAEHVEGPFDLEEDPFPPTEPPNIRTISAFLSVSVENLSFCPSL